MFVNTVGGQHTELVFLQYALRFDPPTHIWHSRVSYQLKLREKLSENWHSLSSPSFLPGMMFL